MSTKEVTPAYLWYTGIWILVAHSVLFYVSFGMPGVGSSVAVDWVSISLFLGMGMVARSMALTAMGVQISIDSVIYIAAAFHLNPVLAAWLTFAGTTGFDLCKLAAERDFTNPRATLENAWWFPSLRHLFSGSVSSVLLLSYAGLFGLGGGYASYELMEVAWKVPLFVSVWLLSQYAIVAYSFQLRGTKLENILRKVALPSFLTEFSLVPVTMLMVLVFDRAAPGKFVVLSFVTLSFIFVLRRIAVTSAKLLARIRELEIVNTFGQMMSSTLDADFLADRIADAVLSIYRDAETVVVARAEGKGMHLECLVYDSSGRRVHSPDMTVAGTIAQWIMDTGGDVQGELGPALRGSGQSQGWVGTPIISVGEVVGVLLCNSSTREGGNPELFRLLDLVSRQAAVALHNSSLYEQATVDGLTNLFVRRYFDQRLEEEFHRAERYVSEFSVILIDVDDFKSVNDTYLHETGDKVLQMVASVVRNCIRAMDVPCRLGGDEFAIILPEAGEDAAKMVGGRICRGVENISLTRNGKIVSVTVSVGVASFPSCEATTAHDVMQKGDIALYRAKSMDGKNQVFAHSECKGLRQA